MKTFNLMELNVKSYKQSNNEYVYGHFSFTYSTQLHSYHKNLQV